MMEKLSTSFPPGTPVRVSQTIARGGREMLVQTFGVVESWEANPTGSWFAHGGAERRPSTRAVTMASHRRGAPEEASAEAREGSMACGGKSYGDRLWLMRLKLRKLDGEVVYLVIDDATAIAKLIASDQS